MNHFVTPTLSRMRLQWSCCFILLVSLSGAVTAAEPGLPLTEDFSDQQLFDSAESNADWSTANQEVVIAPKQRIVIDHPNPGVDAGTSFSLTRAIAAGDINGDGFPDLIAGDTGETNKLYLNDGSGGFSGAGTAVGSETDQTRDLVLGDVDGDLDLVTVARKIPDGVICLISALYFHNITTQIPHAVSIAVKRGKEPPRLKYPPTKIYPFSGAAFSERIETQTIDNTQIKVYSPEKTIADCFKYRNKIGMDTVREAIDLYRSHKKPKPRELLKFAKVYRVEKIMRPYLEAMH